MAVQTPDPFAATIPPGTPPTAEAPPARTAVPTRPSALATQEYVAGTPNYRIAAYAEALPWWVDDATRDFGDDLYERMLLDAQVFSCVEVLKLNVLGEGCNLQPAVEKPQPTPSPAATRPTPPGTQRAPDFARKLEEYNLACEVKDFCQGSLDNLAFSGGQPFESFLYEMLDALALGSRVAEKVYREDTADPADYPRLHARNYGRCWALDRLKPKPRKTVRYVVNPFMDLVGLVAVIPGRADTSSTMAGPFYGTDPARLPNFLPRDKFAVFTYNPRDGDPRGRPVLRPAYDPWWNKCQCKPEFLKYLTQFGSPSLYGTTAPDTEGDFAADDLGNTSGVPPFLDPLYVAPEKKFLQALQRLRNGHVAVGPNGSAVQVINSGGTGAAFLNAFAWYDKQIAKAVLCQLLATEEGEHQARAAAGVHKDVLDIVLRRIRRAVAVLVRHDVLYHLVAYNYGEAVAKKYTPKVTVGSVSDDDWAADAAAVTALVGAAGGQFIKESQYQHFYQMLNIPPPEPENDKPPSPLPHPSAAGNPPPAPPKIPPSPAATPPAAWPNPLQLPNRTAPAAGAPWSASGTGAAGFSRRPGLTAADLERGRRRLQAVEARRA